MKGFFDDRKKEYTNGFFVQITEEREDLEPTIGYIGRYARRPPLSEIELLFEILPTAPVLLADRGYDADWFREALRQRGIEACIPPRKNRKKLLEEPMRTPDPPPLNPGAKRRYVLAPPWIQNVEIRRWGDHSFANCSGRENVIFSSTPSMERTVSTPRFSRCAITR
uniref:Transposase DDE domain-containing protein n=1 Tax=Candidatus Kentrum sp. TC TaxID=2126339 RepID=A0A450YFZ1_9GAMM|nr:MAG: hypothetical protein BECKTC1821E_GA0114239_100751 [Candidatus Kentron sp. TC]